MIRLYARVIRVGCEIMKNGVLKPIIGVVIVLAICLSCLPNVQADGMIIIEPIEIPGMIIFFPEIEFHNVEVEIENQYAKTTIDQSFHNPTNKTMIGTYLFPVPEGAVFSNFTIIFDGKKTAAKVLNTTEAKELFQQAVLESKDASMLQYVDNNIFSCEVTIPPQSSKRMELEYEELLRMTGGMYKYVYTLSTEQFSSVNIESVSISVHIKSDVNIETTYSPSHSISTNRISANEVYVNYSVENARPDKDFELYFSITEKDYSASMLTYNDGEERFFLLFFNSFAEETGEYIAKDIIFVIDKSGSMSGEKIVQAKDALKYIIQELGNDDRFNIIVFDSAINEYSEGMKSASSGSVEDALSYINEIGAGGSTNINDALLDAVDMLKNTNNYDSPRIIFFLTDGLPTAGVTNEESIVQNVYDSNIVGEVDASIFVFGVGYDVNTHLLDKISNQNHGGRVYVNPGDSIEDALKELYGKIQNPLLTDITIEFGGISVYDSLPSEIPNLYSGSEIVLAGKYKTPQNIEGYNNVMVNINGSKGEDNKELTFNFQINGGEKNNFIPRIWASRKIGELMDKIKLEGENETLIKEIKALGLKYGIVTPYTSLLVNEQNSGITSNMSANQQDTDGDGIADAWEKSGEYSNSQSTINAYYRLSYDYQTTSGANIYAYGNKLFAKIEGVFIDLELLAGIDTLNLGNGTIQDWILENLAVTRFITFGSSDYFSLLDDSELIDILAAGDEIVFKYGDDIFYITSGELELAISNIAKGVIDSTVTITWYTNKPATTEVFYRLESESGWHNKTESSLTTRHKITLELPDGSYKFYVSSVDEFDNQVIDDANSKYYKFTTPNVLPVLQISDVSAEVEGKKVTVTWKTNYESIGSLSYRIRDSTGSWSVKFESLLTEEHTIILTSLPYGEYEYFVNSVDENGNTVIDETLRFWEIESLDKDKDGMLDSWEELFHFDPNDPYDAYLDSDNDGLMNYYEFIISTSPLNSDTDSDNLPDKWEYDFNLDPNNPSDAMLDSDNDGYNNLNEYKHKTNPLDPKSHYQPKVEGSEGWISGWNILMISIIVVVIVILIISLKVHSIRSKREEEEYYKDYQDERVFNEPFGSDFDNWDNKYDDWSQKTILKISKKKRKLKKLKQT